MYNEWGSFTNDYWKWMSEQEESMEPAGTCSGTIAMFNSRLPTAAFRGMIATIGNLTSLLIARERRRDA